MCGEGSEGSAEAVAGDPEGLVGADAGIFDGFLDIRPDGIKGLLETGVNFSSVAFGAEGDLGIGEDVFAAVEFGASEGEDGVFVFLREEALCAFAVEEGEVVTFGFKAFLDIGEGGCCVGGGHGEGVRLFGGVTLRGLVEALPMARIGGELAIFAGEAVEDAFGGAVGEGGSAFFEDIFEGREGSGCCGGWCLLWRGGWQGGGGREGGSGGRG